MEDERFDVGKFFRGFNIFNGAALGTMMHQIVIIVIVLSIVGLILWSAMVKRTEHQEQHAGQITNIEQAKGDDFNFFKITLKLLGWGN